MSLELLVGLDDLATERQLTSGWSVVALPLGEASRFSAKAAALLPTGMTEFHAATFNSSDAASRKAYTDFLSLLRTAAESGPGSLLATTLNNKSWHTSLTTFADKFVPTILAGQGIVDQAVIQGAADAAPSLFTLVRLLDSHPGSALLRRLEMDKNTKTGRFAIQNLAVRGVSLLAPDLLAILVNGYRNQLFPLSPAISPSGIVVVDSASSFLVQGADVLGNFSLNYLIRSLGPTTPGRTKKAEIFEHVFHDVLPQTQFGTLASLDPQTLELALNNPGALTFRVEPV